MNKNPTLKKVLFWIVMPTLGALLLAATNMLAPDHYEIEVHSVFMGDVLGPIKISPKGEITFFSLEWNSKVRLINAGCISMDSRLITPTVYKIGDIKNNSNNIII